MKREIGRTGVKVNAIGLGAWQLDRDLVTDVGLGPGRQGRQHADVPQRQLVPGAGRDRLVHLTAGELGRGRQGGHGQGDAGTGQPN